MHFDTIEANLDQAIQLIQNCQEVYELASVEGRRRINQSFFDKFWLYDDVIYGAKLAAPFAQLLDDNLNQRIKREAALPHGATSAEETRYERALPTEAELAAIIGYEDWTPAERPTGPIPFQTETPRRSHTGFEPDTSATSRAGLLGLSSNPTEFASNH